MDNDKVRQQFEAGIKHINFPLTRQGEGYRSPYTHSMWIAYQAGRNDEAAILAEKDRDIAALKEG